VSGGNLTVSAPTHHPQLSRQVMSPSLPTTTNTASSFATMSDDSIAAAIPRAVYTSLPVLTEENFADWDLQIVAHLTGMHDHICVITQTRQSDGMIVNLTKPGPADVAATTNEKRAAKDVIASWERSEQVAFRCIMATAGPLHRELVLKHRKDCSPVYDLYADVCGHHQQNDASQRHEAWFCFLGIHKSADELYMSYYRRIEAAYSWIDHLTPAGQTADQQARELKLFALLSSLPQDDTLRLSLIAQGGLALTDAVATMLRFDTGKKLSRTESEQAFTATQGGCFSCGKKDHFACDCPHREAIQQLVAKRENAGTGKFNKWKAKGRANAAGAANTTATTGTTDAVSSNAARTQEATGVATSFLSSEAHVTHAWLCDTGASSSMSSNRSAFRHLAPDRRPIRLADRKVIWSRGLGSIHFLSECGYLITIQDILFMPDLSVNLFAANSFIRAHQNSHLEVTDYPKQRWINCRTGTTKFTATIHTSGLAYLDWRVAPQGKFANVSMEELHAWLNHLPFSAIRRLMHSCSVGGIPD